VSQNIKLATVLRELMLFDIYLEKLAHSAPVCAGKSFGVALRSPDVPTPRNLETIP
jgi:hypothetical protein